MPQASGERGQHDQDGTLYYSFCSKSQEQVRKLVAGPKCMI
jgi:hypothetical protein